MQLGDILDDVTLDAATGSIEIERVDIDSRECTPGSLFFSLAPDPTAALAHANEAVALGAAAVVSANGLNVAAPVVLVPATQIVALCAYASAAVVRHPEDRTQLVGVTGTNGKTTVTTLVAELARSIEWNGANIGTLTNERTTPASPELFRTLGRLVGEFDPSRNHSVVALEVSSHAIAQHRIDGLRFSVVAFTNLGHDHLDYHGSIDEYFATKASLFTSEHASRAVIWVDDPHGDALASSTSLPVARVTRADAHEISQSLLGTTFFWRGHLINSALIGDYNVDNTLMALAILSELGADDAQLAAAMSGVHAVRGRFDVVHGRRGVVVIDYAHTPDGLERLLRSVRDVMGQGRIISVFGCGGDRDATKRPLMGEVASRLSDLTIVTSDNPRTESPDAIIDAIMSGVHSEANVSRITDRRDAIESAIAQSGEHDVVVIAGKGHETTQVVGDLVLPFNDRDVATELLG